MQSQEGRGNPALFFVPGVRQSMDGVTLVHRTDLHLSDEPPASRTDDWASTCIDKLAQIGEIARATRAAAVIDTADFFHLKSPSRNSHSLVQRAADVHLTYPCPVYSNIGNHDVKYGAMEFLSESPLGVLFSSGVFHRLYDEHEAVFEGGGIKVRVVGIPYHGTKYDMNRLTSLVKGDEDYLVVSAHLLASPGGGTMFEAEDIVKYSDLANMAPDVWCFGHWHKNQGIREVATGKWVVNLGSLTRGSLTQDEMNRTPSVAVMDFSKRGVAIREVQLRVTPAKDVFDVAGRQRMEARTASVDALVDNIRVTVASRAEGSLLEAVRASADVPSHVKERTLSYLEAATRAR